jgi:hypothetical protein
MPRGLAGTPLAEINEFSTRYPSFTLQRFEARGRVIGLV